MRAQRFSFQFWLPTQFLPIHILPSSSDGSSSWISYTSMADLCGVSSSHSLPQPNPKYFRHLGSKPPHRSSLSLLLSLSPCLSNQLFSFKAHNKSYTNMFVFKWNLKVSFGGKNISKLMYSFLIIFSINFLKNPHRLAV